MSPFRVDFSKFFLSGNLNGITIQDSIGFVSERAAKIWMDGVSKNKNKKYIIFNMVLKNTCKE